MYTLYITVNVLCCMEKKKLLCPHLVAIYYLKKTTNVISGRTVVKGTLSRDGPPLFSLLKKLYFFWTSKNYFAKIWSSHSHGLCELVVRLVIFYWSHQSLHCCINMYYNWKKKKIIITDIKIKKPKKINSEDDMRVYLYKALFSMDQYCTACNAMAILQKPVSTLSQYNISPISVSRN